MVRPKHEPFHLDQQEKEEREELISCNFFAGEIEINDYSIK